MPNWLLFEGTSIFYFQRLPNCHTEQTDQVLQYADTTGGIKQAIILNNINTVALKTWSARFLWFYATDVDCVHDKGTPTRRASVLKQLSSSWYIHSVEVC